MRILLINPPSPEQLGSPLLGFQYVAASLLVRGCEVRVIDAAARCFPHDTEWIANEAMAFAPQIIAFSLFTRWVLHAYELVDRLHGGPWLLVSGGAHTTVRPEETLRKGFDLAITGEAEQSLVRIVDWLEGREDIARIPGSVFRQSYGGICYGPPSGFVERLDDLAPPYLAQPLFDPRWYDSSGAETAPGGILTSRGCPARCTFCANYVTGRSFRYRSAQQVTDEINTWHALCGMSYFPLWDDALTANSARLLEFCAAMERDIRFSFAFGSITRANMVTRELLRTMRRAGLSNVNFGVESGDNDILKAIKKGVRTDQVVRALE
jgi:anaerobic magnesium-protoporphyrin IX monomethyl ester cyclase